MHHLMQRRGRRDVRVLGVVAIACLIATSSGVQAANAGMAIHLASATMKSATVGWGIDRRLGGQLVHTGNGGRTWTNVTPHDVTFDEATDNTSYSPPLPPHNTVTWYRSGSMAGTATLIARSARGTGILMISETNDGGRLWHQWTVRLADLVDGAVHDPIVTEADFVNAADGWLLVGPAYGIAAGMGYVGMELWHTTDAGHVWTRVYQIPGSSITAVSPVTFTSATTGWMTEQKGNNNRILLHTTNAGHAWSQVPLTGVAPPDGTPIFHGASGVLFVRNKKYEVMESTDSGQNWGRPQYIPASKSGLSIFKVSAVNPQVLWNSTGNTLWRTVNGGRTWTVQGHAAILTHDTAMDVVNRRLGWVWDATVGDPSTMASTTNGGRTWTPVLVP